MGNCQAAEAATVVIQHPGGKVERVYWSVSASEVMGSNPGHYVAVVVAARAAGENGTPVRHLKLLRPDDTLHIGHVYRLISFEEVLKEFAAKKHVKLSRLLLTQQQQQQQQQHTEKEKKRERSGGRRSLGGAAGPSNSSPATATVEERQPREEEVDEEDVHATEATIASSSGSGNRVGGGAGGGGAGGGGPRHGQWKPALQSIAEVGS